jgi:hypothetical protein
VTIPKFAFSNEDVLALMSNENISLAIMIECFSGCLPVILTVQLHQIMHSYVFFFCLLEDGRASFHNE